jgi:hypothetical protein
MKSLPLNEINLNIYNNKIKNLVNKEPEWTESSFFFITQFLSFCCKHIFFLTLLIFRMDISFIYIKIILKVDIKIIKCMNIVFYVIILPPPQHIIFFFKFLYKIYHFKAFFELNLNMQSKLVKTY